MSEVDRIVFETPAVERPVLVAVDGVDGSGKTTYAANLAETYQREGWPVQVVHLDDYLNPRATRYRLGRHSPEGYFRDTYDLDAFLQHVADPLGPGGSRTIVPRWFDYRNDRPAEAEPITVAERAVVIVEGMFLHRDELAEVWDVSVFLDVPFEVSVARMALRDGSHADPEHPSNRRYVEGQRIYLSSCAPSARATYVVRN